MNTPNDSHKDHLVDTLRGLFRITMSTDLGQRLRDLENQGYIESSTNEHSIYTIKREFTIECNGYTRDYTPNNYQLISRVRLMKFRTNSHGIGRFGGGFG